MSEPVWLDADLLQSFPLPRLPAESDKEDRGQALIVAGSREVPGAAILAAVAALRAGAGKLQVVTDPDVAVPIAIALTGARVLAGFAASIEAIKTASATTLGPGMDRGAELETLLSEVLALRGETPLILDAAPLCCLTGFDAQVREWPGGVALLPHSREMGLLLECDAEEVEMDPLHAAQRAAERYGAVALVKGGISMIAAPDGRAFRFRGGGVGLATSGSGDVLAGIVGGIAARGADPLTATLWGVWLHGEAGRALSTRIGKVGFLAHEIANEVPGLLGR